MIFNEVNIQSEAFANTPRGYRNEFIKFHRGELNTINFLMLLVCHYKQKINICQFENYNHGRYIKINDKISNFNIYKLGGFMYYFDSNGNLSKIEQTKQKKHIITDDKK